jgi:trimeric autotransporter adhesin
MSVRANRGLFCVFAAWMMAFFADSLWAWSTPAATTTTLAVTSAGSTIAPGGSVVFGGVVKLTATVKSNGSAVTTGLVSFCDASAAYCTDIHQIGTAQLTSAGTAVVKFVPGIGSHSYKALFAGTPNGVLKTAGSASSTTAVTVTGIFPTTTTLVSSGSAGNYTLTASVTGLVNSSLLPGPAGMVSFPDTTSGNASLGTAALGVGSAALGFLNSSNPATDQSPYSVAWGTSMGMVFLISRSRTIAVSR